MTSVPTSLRPPPLPAAEARNLLRRFAVPTGTVDMVALERAAGRVLLHDFLAPADLPSQSRAVMDGFAVRAADLVAASAAAPASLVVAGRVEVGSPATPLRPGEAWRVPTGGVVPPGADTVVMQEHVHLAGGHAEIRAPVPAGKNVMSPGDDVARGRPLVPAGVPLEPRHLAALAAFGHTEVAVHGRPRLVVLSTGDEIVPPEQVPAEGKVRDINQVLLSAAARTCGWNVTMGGILEDEPRSLALRLGELARTHEAIVISGGSSVGDKDFTGDVVAAIGTRLFHGISCRPGRPTLAGTLPGPTAEQGCFLLGLPGFPTAAALIFEVFFRPLLQAMTGRTTPPVRVPARLTQGLTSVAGREDYVRVRVRRLPEGCEAEPLGPGAAGLSSLLLCDGFIIIDSSIEVLPAGAWVAVQDLGSSGTLSPP